MKNDSRDQDADLMLYNAYLYPVKGSPIENGAVVIKDGKILQVGSTSGVADVWAGHVREKTDCHGAFLMPGFIEGHGHFSYLGYNLIQLDLLETKSWAEILDSVKARVAISKPGTWIVGRGWHQEKWSSPVEPSVDGYPYNDILSQISPNNPVMLKHASGHAILANAAAMEKASISAETPSPAGGRIVRDHTGKAIGIFEENAMNLITEAYKAYQSTQTDKERLAEWYHAIDEVQDHCLRYGITSLKTQAQHLMRSVDTMQWQNRIRFTCAYG